MQSYCLPVPCLHPNIDQNHFSRVSYSFPTYNLCRLLSRVNNNRKQSESQPTHHNVPRPHPSLPDTFTGNEQSKKITIHFAKPMVFFFLIFCINIIHVYCKVFVKRFVYN